MAILAVSIGFFGLRGVVPVLAALLALGILIFVHEAGHFFTGKLLNFEIKEFAIGFGPKLIGITRKGIDYSIRMIPLGGYVKFNDSDLSDGKLPEPGTFDAEKVWKRLIVVVSGALMNIIIPIFLFTSIYFSYPFASNELAKVLPGTAADIAGLQAGDKITKINGKSYQYWEDIRIVLIQNPSEKVSMVVERDGQNVTLYPVLSYIQGYGFLGVEPKFQEATTSQAIGLGLRSTYKMAALTYDSLEFLIKQPSQILPELSGPVGIVNETSKAYSIGYGTFIWIVGLISVNLAIVNMLPIPPLDGGRFVMLIWEGVTRKPANQKVINVLQTAGIIVFMTLFLYIMVQDVDRVFIKQESALEQKK